MLRKPGDVRAPTVAHPGGPLGNCTDTRYFTAWCPTRRLLLGSVDPDDIQVAVVDALFILVGVTGAALGSGLRLRCLGAEHPAGVRDASRAHI